MAAGRYELVRQIGRGGMAEVFLARRRGAAGIAKRLVVKRVRSDLGSDPRLAELFLREARVATQLSHKNIVTVFDVGRDPEGLFLAMEYVDGPDLSAALAGARAEGAALDPLLAAHIASEVAAGLDHAHRLRDEQGKPLGVVHRDVTPRNILLSLDGEVKVTDFGVAVLHGDAAGERRGTVPYMAPEHARGEAVDARADLFSLGLVLHELLSGRRAYDGADRDAMLIQARAGTVPPLAADVPAELARIVARATAIDPGDRFAGARELQRELAAWAVGERGRRGQTDPLEHALASFLAAAVPAWREAGGAAGEVVGAFAGVAGTATLQSAAATVGLEGLASDAGPAEDGEAVARPETPDHPRETVPLARRPRAARLAAAAAIAIAAIAVVLVATRGDDGPPPRAAAERAPSADPIARGAPADPDPAPATAGAVRSGAAAPTAASVDPAPPAPAVAGAAAAASPPPGSAAHRRADRRRAGRERQPAARGDRAAAPAAAGGITRGPPAAASRATGALDFNAVPWGYVSIDGLPEVETPIRARVLSVGRHRVRVRNPVLEREREVSVEIQAGETTRYVVDLRQ